MSDENPQNLPATKKMTLHDRLEVPAIKKRFEEILGRKAPGFVSSIIFATKLNKDLALCDPDSVISSAMVAAILGLNINPNLGFAHIVPYKGKAQFQMGWKGYNQLALRTGQYARMNAGPVYDGQVIKWDPITGDFEYDLAAKKSDMVIGYVSYFRLSNGYNRFLYMTVNELIKHGKKYSQSFKKGFGNWVDNPEGMYLKTVHKLNISKWGPMTEDMELALRYDQATAKNPTAAIEAGEEIIPEYDDNEDEPVVRDDEEDSGKSKSERLAGKLKGVEKKEEALPAEVPTEEPAPDPPALMDVDQRDTIKMLLDVVIVARTDKISTKVVADASAFLSKKEPTSEQADEYIKLLNNMPKKKSE